MKIGKVYKIIHTQSDIVYIGSTFNTLRDRFKIHKNSKNAKCAIYNYINQYGADQFKIVLIKEYEVIDRKHLEAYEQLWINKTKCININSSFNIKRLYNRNYHILNKEKICEKNRKYHKENKNQILDKQKTYREENKDKISQIKKEWHYKNRNQILQKKKENYENNKKELLDKQKTYRENNKDKINEKTICNICNLTILKRSIKRHENTKKHLDALNSYSYETVR